MPWYLAETYEGNEFRCEQRIESDFGFDAFVLTGARTLCHRRTWPAVTLDIYPVLTGYVFVEMHHFDIIWDDFKRRVGIIDFISYKDYKTGRPSMIEIDHDIMQELFKRQSSGEFSDWLTNARRYFLDRIGTQFELPSGRFEGAHATVTNIVGDTLHWSFEILGTKTSGVLNLSKVWPKDNQAAEYAATIELSESLKLFTNKRDYTPVKPLNLPQLEPFSME